MTQVGRRHTCTRAPFCRTRTASTRRSNSGEPCVRSWPASRHGRPAEARGRLSSTGARRSRGSGAPRSPATQRTRRVRAISAQRSVTLSSSSISRRARPTFYSRRAPSRGWTRARLPQWTLRVGCSSARKRRQRQRRQPSCAAIAHSAILAPLWARRGGASARTRRHSSMLGT